MKDVVVAAQSYIDKGWQVVPLAPKSKACTDPSWTKLIFKPEDFRKGDNIGLRSVNGLVDIDCDSAEVVALAKAFLPATDAIYGRPNKPAAHWLYQSTFDRIIAYRDVGVSADISTLIEIRVNHQSMAPPSVHPDGQELEWVGDSGLAAEVENTVLHRSVRLLATSALVVRYYNPPGNRHDWSIALSGLCRKLGFSEQEALTVFVEAAKYIDDSDIQDRINSVTSTYNRPEDEPIASIKALKECMEKAKNFLGSIKKIWGAGDGGFLTDDKDRILANNQENVRRAFKKLEVELTFDKFAQKPYISFNGVKSVLNDAVRNRLWLTIDERFHFRPSADFFDIMLTDTARQNSYHPVLDYLKGLKWDKKPRLDEWLIKCAGAKDDKKGYVRAVSSIFLKAAVRRAKHPGCKFDEMPILESQQGLNKSTAIRLLCPNEEWFSDDLPLNVDAKQLIERTAGKLIIEAPELSGMPRTGTEHLKALLSRGRDGPVRLAYARLPVEVPRQFVIIGTTNSYTYLKDYTGNRRFWPVRVKNFNLQLLKKIRDQLWAEAAYREAQGESIRLPTELYGVAKEYQDDRRIEDPWEEPLQLACPQDVQLRFSRDEIFDIVRLPVERRDAKASSRISAILQRLGFRRVTVKRNKIPTKGWGREPLKQQKLPKDKKEEK